MSDRPEDADDNEAHNKAAPPVISYQSPTQAIKWVSVWTAQNTLEANLAVATLQEHGIHARLDMENSAGLGLAYAGVMYAKVQVLPQDAEAARALILEIHHQRTRRKEAMTLACPRCGARTPDRILHPVRYVALALLAGFLLVIAVHEWINEMFPSGWLALLLLVTGLATLVWGITPRWRCKSCGNRWHAKEPEEVEEDEEGEEDAERQA